MFLTETINAANVASTQSQLNTVESFEQFNADLDVNNFANEASSSQTPQFFPVQILPSSSAVFSMPKWQRTHSGNSMKLTDLPSTVSAPIKMVTEGFNSQLSLPSNRFLPFLRNFISSGKQNIGFVGVTNLPHITLTRQQKITLERRCAFLGRRMFAKLPSQIRDQSINKFLSSLHIYSNTQNENWDVGPLKQDFEQVWASVKPQTASEKWLEEYERSSNTDKTHAWESEYSNQLFENAWKGDDLTQKKNDSEETKELKQVCKAFNSLSTDKTIKSTNFFRTMKRLARGELEIQKNNLIETHKSDQTFPDDVFEENPNEQLQIPSDNPKLMNSIIQAQTKALEIAQQWQNDYNAKTAIVGSDWAKEFISQSDKTWKDEFAQDSKATEMSDAQAENEYEETEIEEKELPEFDVQQNIDLNENEDVQTLQQEDYDEEQRINDQLFGDEIDPYDLDMGIKSKSSVNLLSEMDTNHNEIAEEMMEMEAEVLQMYMPRSNSPIEDEKEENGTERTVAYKFSQKDNPYLHTGSPLATAAQLSAQGELGEAVLAAEAAVVEDVNNASAWQLLGHLQALDDDDVQALAALNEANRLKPHQLDTLMAMAISYTNLTNREMALEALSDWIQSNPKYRYLSIGSANISTQSSSHSSFSLSSTAANAALAASDEKSIFSNLLNSFDKHNEVLHHFLSAARNAPEEIDPDVQIGLGLLFSLTSEYGRAADCFETALRRRPRDSRVWNKLGATLANSNRNSEAVDAYNHALQINPSYTRARTNLGISLVALGKPFLAAKEFLSAIILSGAKEDTHSSHFWEYMMLAAKLCPPSINLEKPVSEKDIKTLREILGV